MFASFNNTNPQFTIINHKFIHKRGVDETLYEYISRSCHIIYLTMNL